MFRPLAIICLAAIIAAWFCGVARAGTPLRHTAPLDMSTEHAVGLDIAVPWGERSRGVAATMTGQVGLFDVAAIGVSMGMAWADHDDADLYYAERATQTFGPSNLALRAHGAWCAEVGWTVCLGASVEVGIDPLREDTERDPACAARGLAYAADGSFARFGTDSLWVVEPWAVANASGDGFFVQVAAGPIFGPRSGPLWGVHGNVAWQPFEWGAVSVGVRAAGLVTWGDEMNVCYDGLWPYGKNDDEGAIVHLDTQLRFFAGQTTAYAQVSVPFFTGDVVGRFDEDAYSMTVSFGARQEF